MRKTQFIKNEEIGKKSFELFIVENNHYFYEAIRKEPSSKRSVDNSIWSFHGKKAIAVTVKYV